ncbi:CLUMA_CG010382, isoform A [Clunio marinus]|uniref:CLUMA_CG010382, isoform A n=1 Tax=Clunio marinus TaxID=568069 RepID=A0A1J1I9E4_9DIPT|nr:CLUMA_CG010382, isoform A [Clunio marinus]
MRIIGALNSNVDTNSRIYVASLKLTFPVGAFVFHVSTIKVQFYVSCLYRRDHIRKFSSIT